MTGCEGYEGHQPGVLVQVKALELPLAEGMLSGLLSVSASMVAADEEDARLEGKLSLLHELVMVLDRRHSGTAAHGNLVHRIITGERARGEDPSLSLQSVTPSSSYLLNALIAHLEGTSVAFVGRRAHF